ncbi:hypothetical protein AB3Z07_08870 [Metabacillus halosaccharovorans]|uniref:hypothetical protein n=1 Tax=Metabacillus halosaccharovorans TaxID=930124 RepID=UPI0034CD8968
MKNGKVFYGVCLIGLGLFFSLQSFGLIGNLWSVSWPIILLFVSVGFHLGFFLSGGKKQQAGLLVPGGILFVLSLLFMFEEMTNWSFSGFIWPFYLFAVAFGLFELWLFGGKEVGLLIPIFILSGLGVVFLIQNLFTFNILSFWPAILIIIGLFLIFGRGRHHSKDL